MRAPALWRRLTLCSSLLAIGATAQGAITLSRDADLGFGKVVAGLSAGTVTVTPAGARSASGGVTLGSGTLASAASFTVTGPLDQVYSITVPLNNVVSLSGPGTMKVNDFVTSPSGTGTLSTPTATPGEGRQTITVGATLIVDPSQPNGSYTGNFDVTVWYP